MADGSRVVARNERLVSVTSEAVLPDLHLTIDGSVIDIRCSSTPVGSLHVSGGAMAGIRTVRLNGIARARRAGERATVLAIASADWSTQSSERFDRNALCVA
jgi:hypothetical protein